MPDLFTSGQNPALLTENCGVSPGRPSPIGSASAGRGFAWKGIAEIGREAYWPGWTPPPEMLERQPEPPAHVDGGMDNPLGARALYLFEDHKHTLFRIHGADDPKSIGKAGSSGFIRMLNADVIDLYQRVGKGGAGRAAVSMGGRSRMRRALGRPVAAGNGITVFCTSTEPNSRSRRRLRPKRHNGPEQG